MQALLLSHTLAALMFALIALGARHPRAERTPLALPSALTAVWSALLATEVWFSAGRELVALAELGRNLAWFWYLHSQFHTLRRQPEWLWVGGALLALALPLQLISALDVLEQTRAWGNVALPLLFAVAVLAQVEQVWRHTAPQQRWAVKFICLGLGGVYAFDFYLHSEALLFSRPEADAWAARGVTFLFLGPLLWVGQGRLAGLDQGWALSHRMAFHTAAVLGGGIYLLIMAAVGYYLRLAGGVWGGLLQSLFLSGALLLLSLLLLSGAARAWLRAFLGRHFFRYRYDYREQWLRFTDLLDSGHGDAPIEARVAEALARLADSSGAALWLRRENGAYRRAAHWNLGALKGELNANHPFLLDMEQTQGPVNLTNLREQGPTNTPEWLLDSPHAWVVQPLIWRDRLLGFVVLAPGMAPSGFDWEITELLRTAARQAAAYLAQAEAAEALSVARQFESFHRTSAFVVHDIKNLAAQLSLLLSNAVKHRHNPEFQEDMLSTVESALGRMNRLLAKLAEPSRDAAEELVDLNAVLIDITTEKAQRKPHPIYLPVPVPLRVRAHRERLARVLGHMVQNALEATPGDGRVGVTLNRVEDRAVVSVEDDGHGMDERFVREKLFRPFYSTKDAGMGIGAYECKDYVESLGGDIQVDSRPGLGTRIVISLPLARDPDA